MKKYLALLTLVLAFGFAGIAQASTVCTLEVGDPLLADGVPAAAVVKHPDGSWQVQCPRVNIKTIGSQSGFQLGVNLDNESIYAGPATNLSMDLSRAGMFAVNDVAGSHDGFTVAFDGNCGGDLTYGDKAACTITYTEIPIASAPAPMQASSPAPTPSVPSVTFVLPSSSTPPPEVHWQIVVVPDATSTPDKVATSTPAPEVIAEQATTTASTTPSQTQEIVALKTQISLLNQIIGWLLALLFH